MSPVKIYHAAVQGKIAGLLYCYLDQGHVLSECAIKTGKGTKVANVAWSSDDRFEVLKEKTECSIAPEICVEILSESNTKAEIEEKKVQYFVQGAVEVWICDKHGRVAFNRTP